MPPREGMILALKFYSDPVVLSALMTFQIGNHKITNPVILAPMAGVTDWPFREMARRSGAGLCISEMVTANTDLWHTAKSSTRLPSLLDPAPRPVQIAGADPSELAEAARRCVDMGAGIIDINMGCPAKKVCNKAAGSALLANEKLVCQILEAVVAAVDVPVTLKTRTGTDPDNQNILSVAKQAEQIGIQALSIHGRTRACKFRGDAGYERIAEVAAELQIPVIANGDITTPEKAKHVMEKTGASALMIGRGAWGKPWLLGQIADYLQHNSWSEPSDLHKQQLILSHLELLYEHYDEYKAVRFARKHIDWYLKPSDPDKAIRRQFNQLTEPEMQIALLEQHFANRNDLLDKAA